MGTSRTSPVTLDSDVPLGGPSKRRCPNPVRHKICASSFCNISTGNARESGQCEGVRNRISSKGGSTPPVADAPGSPGEGPEKGPGEVSRRVTDRRGIVMQRKARVSGTVIAGNAERRALIGRGGAVWDGVGLSPSIVSSCNTAVRHVKGSSRDRKIDGIGPGRSYSFPAREMKRNERGVTVC